MPHDSKHSILIISEEFDPHVDWMMALLQHVEVPCIRWPTSFFPLQSTLRTKFSNHGIGGELEIAGKVVRLSEIRSVWYRHPAPFVVSSSLSADEKRFAQSEANAAFTGLLRLFDWFWVNHPDKIRIASCKMLQLRVAIQLGFNIPKTLVSNDPAEVREFFADCDGEIIYKAFGSGFVPMSSKVCLTSRVLKEHLKNIDLIRTSGGIFQENVPKELDLRITVIGRKVFAVEIHSQDIDVAKQDWRAGNVEKMVHREHELPPQVEASCLKLLDHFGLVYGAIDMIRTRDGRYVFLENNPVGQFGWVEGRAGLPLTTVMAEMLIAGRVP